jgi:hypothetical protein
MVMIPLITFLLISLLIEKPANVLLLIAAAQLIWNLTFGLIPLSRAGGEHEKFMIEKLKEPGKVLLIARDDQLMKSINYYYSGKKDEIRILRSPAVTKLKGIDLTKYKASIDSSLSAGVTIYTDCIGRMPVSRATISEGKINEAFFSEYKLLRIYSDTLAAGGKSVYRIIAE